MKPPRLPSAKDLARLTGPLCMLGAVVLGTVALYFWSTVQLEAGRAERLAVQVEVSRLQQQVVDAEGDEREFARSLARFRGVAPDRLPRAGDIDRLAWLETARMLAAHLEVELPELEMGPELAVNWIGAGEQLALRASDVTLRSALWHEADLFTLLGMVRRVGEGYAVPLACELAPAQGVRGGGPRLTASCELVWLYLGERTEVADANGSEAGSAMDAGLDAWGGE